jgi:hypothetical protein
MTKANGKKVATATTAPAATTRGSYKLASKITVLAKENPKREGTTQHTRFKQLLSFGGKTVDQYLKAGGLTVTLHHAEDIKAIKVA